jgi:hypothetical protein
MITMISNYLSLRFQRSAHDRYVSMMHNSPELQGIDGIQLGLKVDNP